MIINVKNDHYSRYIFNIVNLSCSLLFFYVLSNSQFYAVGLELFVYYAQKVTDYLGCVPFANLFFISTLHENEKFMLSKIIYLSFCCCSFTENLEWNKNIRMRTLFEMQTSISASFQLYRKKPTLFFSQSFCISRY